MSNKALVIDYKYCTGCYVCEVSCQNEHEIPLDEWGIKIVEQGPVRLDGKWMWNYVPIPSDLCDLCVDRIDRGEPPACVLHCPAACMEVVELEDLGKRMAELGKSVVSYIP